MLVIWCHAVLVDVELPAPFGTRVLTHDVHQSSCHVHASCFITALRPAEKAFVRA